MLSLLSFSLLPLALVSASELTSPLEVELNLKGFYPGPKSIELARASCLARELYLDGTSLYKKLTSAELATFKTTLEPKLPLSVVEGVNVNLTCQYAYFLRGGKITKFFPISSGRVGHETKPGVFKIWYQYDHWWESTLYPGAWMYRPKYFDHDSAFHGLKSDSWVYPYPNSHGCLRTKIKMMDYLWKNMRSTDRVWIYGKYLWK